MKTQAESPAIEYSPDAQRLTTTLNLLLNARACEDSYRHLVKSLGGTKFDHNAPINLLTILEHNGTEDCIWALCAVSENCDKVARLIAADFAEAVLPLYEKRYPADDRPRKAIEAARAYARGEIGDAARSAAGAAAGAAAKAAAGGGTAWDAAWDAARDAARSAAWAAFGDAIGAADWDPDWDPSGAAACGSARDAQRKILLRYLLP